MIQWFKNLSRSEKIMIGLILMLLLGIISRWQVIEKEGGEAIRSRFELDDVRKGNNSQP